MSEMTASRTGRFWAIGVAAAAWLFAAWLLWRTSVPGDLDPVDVEPAEVFSRAHLERSDRYERFLRANWATATVIHIGVLLAVVRLAPRVRWRGIPGGVALGVAALAA